MWENTMWNYLKAIKGYRPLLKKDLSWTLDEDTNKGFTDDTEGPQAERLTAQKKMDICDDIVQRIVTYGPKSIYIDITERATSYKIIFDSIKRVCGFPVPGAQLIQYVRTRSSFDKTGTESYNDFYWRLRDEKIASLMKVASGVKFRGKALERDEQITPMLENQVVCDWIYGIGGLKLVNYVAQEYAKELETTSIFDLQEIIGNQEVMRGIIERMESEETARMSRVQSSRGKGQTYVNSRQNPKESRQSKNTYEKRWCYFCEELKNGNASTHNTEKCLHREKNKKNKKAKNFQVEVDEENSEDDEQSEEEQMSELLQKMRSDE